MLFDSIQFIFFFLTVTTLYFLIPHRYRWFLLLAASCYFYMAFVPVYILILGFTIVIDYFAGIWIERSMGSKRKLFLTMSLVANIGILCFFKYYNFINGNISQLLGNWGAHNPLPYLTILLPIGLSFHTFQAMSYTIEVYRGNQQAERNFGIYALYVMFYPQLVAGPIERPQNLLHQFYEQHDFDPQRISAGLRQVMIGFLKKLVIADRVAIYVNDVYNNYGSQSGRSLAVATVFFSFQIYCDFSAYSDIAIGVARVMGFNLMTNFKRPYFATSVSQFWRRWHISLSTWFKDYLYFPLGGSRVDSRWKLYRNMMIVFLISGLWHGANWTYVVWGALNGLFLIAESFFVTPSAKGNWLKTLMRTLLTFILISFAWIFFRSPNVHAAFYIINQIAHFTGPFDPGFPEDHFYYAVLAISGLLFFEYLQEYKPQVYNKLPNTLITRFGYYIAVVVIIMLFGVFNGGQFIYFQF